MAKKAPILRHDSGVSLYAPTPTFTRFRLVYRDPLTGARCQPGYPDRESAEEPFQQAVAYVTAAMHAAPAYKPTGRAVLVDDLFERVVERWKLGGKSARYVEKRKGTYRKWIKPVCGRLEIRSWSATDRYCLQVLANARDAGLARSTRQDIGALLRRLVTVGWMDSCLPRTADPMFGVQYSAKRSADDEGLNYVLPSARPSTANVSLLVGEFDREGLATGRPWLRLMPEVAGYGGLRFGELTALRARDVRDAPFGVRVETAWSWSKTSGPVLGPPKNGRRRLVLLPASLRQRLLARAEEVERTQGPDGLLFPSPKGPDAPFSNDAFATIFRRCARAAGWHCKPDYVTPKGQKVKGRPIIPFRNLRHHAATWMHDVAGYDWVDVSRSLGHASVAFTQSRYVRPAEDAERRNAARMAEL
jgi:integrase